MCKNQATTNEGCIMYQSNDLLAAARRAAARLNDELAANAAKLSIALSAPMPGEKVADPKIWSTEDGHRFTSIPTAVPARWALAERSGILFYVSGPYEIERKRYGSSGHSYGLRRDGVELFGFYSRLKDAKAHAEKNARGEEIVNVA